MNNSNKIIAKRNDSELYMNVFIIIIFTHSRICAIENKTDEIKTKSILMFISTKMFVPVIDELDENRKRIQYKTRKQDETVHS